MTSETANRVRNHIAEMFLFDENDSLISDDASLLEYGVVDSTGVLDLIVFVEDEFGIRVADEEVTPANFDSVNRLASFVESKLRDAVVTSTA